MKAIVLLLFMIISLESIAQTEADTTAIQQVEPPTEEIKEDVQKRLRELADSVRQTSGTEEAIEKMEALRQELNNSINALGDSLRQEDPSVEQVPVVDQFKKSFQRIREGLSNTLTVGNLVAIAMIIAFGTGINALLRRWVGHKEMTPHRRRLRRLRWYPLLRFVNWSIVVILIATLLLRHPDVLWPALTALAIGLGLAVKDSLVNLLGGLWLIFERPYQIGDRIEAGGHYGEVTRIGIRSTQITTLDDNLVTIPNSKILEDPVSNANAGETDCMAVVQLWLPPNADLQMVRSVAYEAAITSRYFNFDKGVHILFHDHIGEPPGTILKVKAYVLDARYEKAFEGDVTETVKKAFVQSQLY